MNTVAMMMEDRTWAVYSILAMLGAANAAAIAAAYWAGGRNATIGVSAVSAFLWALILV